MNKIKSILLSILILSLTSCSILPSNNSTPKTPENFTVYEKEEFNIAYPNDWEIIEQFSNKYPAETQVAFRNPTATEGFNANVNIIKNILTQNISTNEYGQSKIDKHKISLSNYEELDKKNIEIQITGENKESIMILFSGKYEPDGPTYKFMQAYAVKDNIAYTITGSMTRNEGENVVNQIQSMLKSFALK